MADLSPAAQVVLDALLNAPVNSAQVCNGKAPQIKLAAALRAAAGSVPKDSWGGENYATGFRDGIAFSCQFLHELAAELDNN